MGSLRRWKVRYIAQNGTGAARPALISPKYRPFVIAA
jgi:hypothetical protein